MYPLVSVSTVGCFRSRHWGRTECDLRDLLSWYGGGSLTLEGRRYRTEDEDRGVVVRRGSNIVSFDLFMCN